MRTKGFGFGMISPVTTVTGSRVFCYSCYLGSNNICRSGSNFLIPNTSPQLPILRRPKHRRSKQKIKHVVTTRAKRGTFHPPTKNTKPHNHTCRESVSKPHPRPITVPPQFTILEPAHFCNIKKGIMGMIAHIFLSDPSCPSV